MARTRWKGERVSGKKEDNVIEASESFAEARPLSSQIGWFKGQSQPKRSVIENHWRSWKNKYVILEDEGADWWGQTIDLHVWESLQKEQILSMVSVWSGFQVLSAWSSGSQGFRSVWGLLATVKNMKHEQKHAMMNLPEAKSNRSNQEMFTHTKASLHYPQRGFISVF